MSPIDTELLELAMEALASHKDKLDILDKKCMSLKKTTTLTDATIQKELEAIHEEVKKTIVDAMNSVELPKDGVDGENGLDGIDGKDGLDGAKGEDGVSITGPKGKDGRDGVDGRDGKDADVDELKAYVDRWLGNKEEAVVADTVIKISDIDVSDGKLYVVYSDGTDRYVDLPKAKELPPQGPADVAPGGVYALSRLLDVDVRNTRANDVLTYDGKKWVSQAPVVGVGDAVALEARVEIEEMYKVAYDTSYREIIYTLGNISQIDVYVDNSKGVKLFTKTIWYNVDNNIETVSITDEVAGTTLSKVITYVDGNVSTISSTFN